MKLESLLYREGNNWKILSQWEQLDPSHFAKNTNA